MKSSKIVTFVTVLPVAPNWQLRQLPVLRPCTCGQKDCTSCNPPK